MKLKISVCLILQLILLATTANAGLFSRSRDIYVSTFQVESDFSITAKNGKVLDFKSSVDPVEHEYDGIAGVTHSSDVTLCGDNPEIMFPQIMLTADIAMIASKLSLDDRNVLTEEEIKKLSSVPLCEPFIETLSLVARILISTPEVVINNPKVKYVKFKKNKLTLKVDDDLKVIFKFDKKYKLNSDGIPKNFDDFYIQESTTTQNLSLRGNVETEYDDENDTVYTESCTRTRTRRICDYDDRGYEINCRYIDREISGEREYWYEGLKTTTTYTLTLIKVSGEVASKILFKSFENGRKIEGPCRRRIRRY